MGSLSGVEQAWEASGRSALDELFEAVSPRDGSAGEPFTAAMLAPHAWAEIKRLRKAPALSVEEATAIVSAALSEDHDSESLDRAIKRLGDWVDAQLATEETWCDGSGAIQVQVERVEPDRGGHPVTAGQLLIDLKAWSRKEEERLRDERERPASNQRDRDHIDGSLAVHSALRRQLRSGS